MKAVVVSIEGKKAAVLAADGTFNSIENRDYRVGETLEYDAAEGRAGVLSFVRYHAPKLMAAAAAVLIFGGAVTANTYAFSTVTLDVNPSLRYELNIFDRVVDFDSYNDEGAEIVTMVAPEVLGSSIEQAVDITLDALEETDYIEQDTPVMMTVDSHLSREKKLERKTKEEMDGWNDRKSKSGVKKSVSGESVIVPDELAKRAKDKKKSPGKVYMVDCLKGVSTGSVDEDEWLDRSIPDLKKEIEKRKGPSGGPGGRSPGGSPGGHEGRPSGAPPPPGEGRGPSHVPGMSDHDPADAPDL